MDLLCVLLAKKKKKWKADENGTWLSLPSCSFQNVQQIICTLLGEFFGNEPNVCLFLFFALTQAINHNDIDQFFVCF